MTKGVRALSLLVCLLLLPGLALAEAPAHSRFRGAVPPPEVPEGAKAPEAYFEDAVFIGDSLMASMELHGMFSRSVYAAAVGISPLNAMGPVYDTVTGKKHLKELLRPLDCTKLYVLLGANALDGAGTGTALKRYAAFLDKLVAACPDQLIYVISIPPRASRGLTGLIGGFNRELREACGARGVYFLDIYSRMLDPDGGAARRFLAGDGLHLSREGSCFVRDYIMTHTVGEEP